MLIEKSPWMPGMGLHVNMTRDVNRVPGPRDPEKLPGPGFQTTRKLPENLEETKVIREKKL